MPARSVKKTNTSFLQEGELRQQKAPGVDAALQKEGFIFFFLI